MSALASLSRYVRRAPATAPASCDLCAARIDDRHAHVVDVAERRLLCACGPCAFLFSNTGSRRHRRVPDRVLTDPSFAPDESKWRDLGVPVGLAFFFRSSVAAQWLACFPSAAGVTEAELAPEAWERLAGGSPFTAEIEPDVEALLARTRRGGRTQCYLVPIDVCYELAGIVRRRWRGFDGGDDVRAEIDAFFERLDRRARSVEEGG